MDEPVRPRNDGHGDAGAIQAPERFMEALQHVRTAIAACAAAGIPQESVLAALMAELMPRLGACYGPQAVSAMLGHVANAMGDIAAAQKSSH